MKSSHMVTPILYMSVLLHLGEVGTSNLSGGVYCTRKETNLLDDYLSFSCCLYIEC